LCRGDRAEDAGAVDGRGVSILDVDQAAGGRPD